MSMQPSLMTERYDRRLGAPGFVWSGHLERVFSHAAVARADGEGAGLILLHPERDLVPRGVQVPWAALAPRAGDRLRVARNQLQVTSVTGVTRRVDLAGEGIDLRLGAPGPGCRLALGYQLAALGLTDRVRQVLGDTDPGPEMTGRECALLCLGLHALVTALGRDDAGGAAKLVVTGLVGLGIGATPAGDDVIVGAIAAARRFGGLGWMPSPGLDSILEAVLNLPAGATTPAGRAMLAQAAGGCFPWALVRMVRALASPTAEPAAIGAAQQDLLRLGASSGQDMLAGVLATARAVIDWRR